MKIAVSAAGRNPDSPMDARFGRAGYFQIFDDANASYANLGWQRVGWNDYNNSGGGTRPALGDTGN